MKDFIGSKAALFYDGKLIVYLRDNKPGLRYANKWDFPGGAREANETPEQCLIREVEEEFSIKLQQDQLIWTKTYPAMYDKGKIAYFFVAHITKTQFEGIRFGEEGQKWMLVNPKEFLSRDDVVEPLKIRLRDYLASIKA